LLIVLADTEPLIVNVPLLLIAQLKSVVAYASNTKECKNKTLLAYFGETIEKDCGICSFCISKKKSPKKNDKLPSKIIELLKSNDFNSREIQKSTKANEDDVIFALQTLMEDNRIILKSTNLYSLKKN